MELSWAVLAAFLVGLAHGFNGDLAKLECPDDCICHYSRINWVADCSNSNLTEIPHDELSLNVYRLDLNNNRITEVGTFNPGIKIRSLQLAENLLSEIERNSFAGLKYFIEADLSRNNITKVDPVSFEDSPGFITLELQGNPLDPVDTSFMSMKSLLNLDISRCGLCYLNSQFFSNMTTLSTLDLSGNPLGRIDNEVFEPLVSLESLKMNDCNLAFIAVHVFSSQGNLKVLELSGNKFLNNDWSSTFAHLTRLEYLDLRNCGIKQISENIFSNNMYLRTLILAMNQLKSFNVSRTIGKLRHLDTLDLSYSNLSLDLSEDLFVNATKLRCLCLSGNSLHASDLPVALASLDNLEKLSLSNCGMIRLPDPFLNLHNLQKLDISQNPIKDASVRLLKPLDKLEYLSVGYSNLSSIAPKSFSQMTSMRRLILSGNHFKNLGAGLFGELTRLESLELNFCGLTRPISAALFSNNPTYTNLKELKLAGNPLQVPKVGPLLPKQLSYLEKLDLSNCNLTFLPAESFMLTRNITTLILSRNRFSSQKDFKFLKHLPQLGILDLSYNNLTSFSPKDILQNPRVENLNFLGNPWKCDCSVADLWYWALLEKGNLGILKGSTLAAKHSTSSKTKRMELLVCIYNTVKQPLPIVMNKTLSGRRPFIERHRIHKATNRTWAEYVKKSGCEQFPSLIRQLRAANANVDAYVRSSELVTNNWIFAALKAAVVYVTIMMIIGVGFVLNKRRTAKTTITHKTN